MQKPQIGMTKDTDGFLEVTPESDSWVDYNVSVENAGRFAVNIRCKTNPGTKFEILSGDSVLASAQATTDDWQNVKTSLSLPKGNQTLRVRTTAFTHLNWTEFTKN